MRKPEHEDDRAGRVHTAAFGIEPTTPGDCPTAAELAAWIDEASTTGGRAQWDGHIAQCARCQQVVAAFAAADPPDAIVQPQPLPARQQTRFWSFRWNWALSAAAVVVVAAFGWLVVRPVVYETVSTPSVETSPDLSMAARVEPSDHAQGQAPGGRARMEAAGGAQSPNTQAGIREEAAKASGETSAAGGSAARDPLAEGATVGAPPGAPASVAGARAAEATEAPTAISAKAEAPAGASDPAGIAATRRPTEPARAQPGRIAQPGAAALAAAPPAAEKPAQALAEDRAAAPRPAVQRVGLAEDAATTPRAGGEILVVAAGSPAVRWRARPGGVFEYSTDEGRSWVRLEVTDARQVLAGSAPSRSVCWFVGRRGLVVRVGPGVRLDVVGFPDVVDLVDVEANSALVATVIAADGRSFYTSDGGATWRQ